MSHLTRSVLLLGLAGFCDSAPVAPEKMLQLAGVDTVVTLIPATLTAQVGDRDTLIGRVKIGTTICVTCAIVARNIDSTKLAIVARFKPPGQKKLNGIVVRALAPGQARVRAGFKGHADTSVVTVVAALKVLSILVRPESVAVAPGDTVRFCAAARTSDDSVRLTSNSASVPACKTMFTNVPGFTLGTAWQTGTDTAHIAIRDSLLPDGRLLLRSTVADAFKQQGEWWLVKPLRGGRLIS